MPIQTKDFIATFNSLKSLLKNYENSLRVFADNNDSYCLNACYDEKRKADIFGTRRSKKITLVII
jgi:hypothetical protein